VPRSTSASVDVLYVDDDVHWLETVATCLEREQERLAVQSETSAQVALEAMRTAPVDVVLSDYEMSEVNGLDFLEHVRVAHPDIPFIPYTGRGSEAVASDAVARGVTEYVQKGSGRVHVAELATRILTTVDTTE